VTDIERKKNTEALALSLIPLVFPVKIVIINCLASEQQIFQLSGIEMSGNEYINATRKGNCPLL
jgi:hypothetical protein